MFSTDHSRRALDEHPAPNHSRGDRNRQLLLAALAAAAALTTAGGLATSAASSARALPAPGTVRTPVTVPTQFTPTTLDMTGTWKMVSSGSHTVFPGAGAGTLYTRLTKTTLRSPTNDPVYEGDKFGDSCKPSGQFFLTPYVTNRGIVVTVWETGDAVHDPADTEAVYGLRSINTMTAPLDFAGFWTDSDGKVGTTEMTSVPTRLFTTAPCS